MRAELANCSNEFRYMKECVEHQADEARRAFYAPTDAVTADEPPPR